MRLGGCNSESAHSGYLGVCSFGVPRPEPCLDVFGNRPILREECQECSQYRAAVGVGIEREAAQETVLLAREVDGHADPPLAPAPRPSGCCFPKLA